ncbi:MAG: hypothetical protein Q9M36_06840 [Sulfurovum sp.]|nr:hypothetical protein [Sulfurovum sp.]MDQ7084651.1 hypothetical protein [Sulfurovum sp.]
MSMNASGLINSLDGVKAELESIGLQVINEGHDWGKNFDYLTIQSGETKMRLGGDIYGNKFYEHNREDRSKAIDINSSIEKKKPIGWKKNYRN